MLSRAAAIEVYAPALFMDVALIAYCLRSSFTRDRSAVTASLLLLLAVGFHVTNLLVIPFIVALVIGRTPASESSDPPLGGETVLLGLGAILALLWLGPGAEHGRPIWP